MVVEDSPPRVSVIIATYRRNDELRRAIASVAEQTYEPIEIVVVDDNADPSWCATVRDIIEEVLGECQRRAVYISNETTRGSADTRNRGITACTGEYVTFLDDDDVYLPHKVERQVAEMVRVDADYSITDLLLVGESGRPIEYRRRDYIKSDDPVLLMQYHYMHHMTGTDTLMLRRDYLLRIGGFPPIDMGDEFYLMREAIVARGRFTYLRDCGVRAYVHSSAGGMSSGQRKIDFENALFREKQAHFGEFDSRAVAYISMRHWAVLSFAEFRRRRRFMALVYAGRAFIASPAQCMSLFLRLR